MRFLKVTSDGPKSYSLGQLRRDNPNTSFPKSIPLETLADYGVFPYKTTEAPAYDSSTHYIKDAGFQTNDLGEWEQHFEVVELSLEKASENVRGKREKLLKDTDYLALSDVTMPADVAVYRQALRDITNQEGFPYTVVWPTKP